MNTKTHLLLSTKEKIAKALQERNEDSLLMLVPHFSSDNSNMSCKILYNDKTYKVFHNINSKVFTIRPEESKSAKQKAIIKLSK